MKMLLKCTSWCLAQPGGDSHLGHLALWWKAIVTVLCNLRPWRETARGHLRGFRWPVHSTARLFLKLVVTFIGKCNLLTVWEKSNLPGPHGANTCGASHLNPRVPSPGIKAPPALHIVLRGFWIRATAQETLQRALGIWTAFEYLNKHWPKSQATATKRANIQTKTNNYFSDFVSFVLIFWGIWMLGISWPWWGEGASWKLAEY